MTPLLSVRDLHVWLDTARGPLSIVDGVSFDVGEGQVFGLAGESGSGKTITALALLGLLPAGARTGGVAIMAGRDLLAMRTSERRRTRGREIAMVFQDPTSSLHPMLTIERQLTEHLRYQLVSPWHRLPSLAPGRSARLGSAYRNRFLGRKRGGPNPRPLPLEGRGAYHKGS